jgi:hypothetical protein
VSNAHAGRWVGGLVVLATAVPIAAMIRANVWASDHEQFCKGVYLVPDSSVGAVIRERPCSTCSSAGGNRSAADGMDRSLDAGGFTSGSARVTVERFTGSPGWFATGVCISSGRTN